jgi:hypothetical protein
MARTIVCLRYSKKHTSFVEKLLTQYVPSQKAYQSINNHSFLLSVFLSF